MDQAKLRVRMVDARRIAPRDAKILVTGRVAEQLLAMLYEETVIDGGRKGEVTVLSRYVERSEVRGLGSDTELFAAALENARRLEPVDVDVMRVDEQCRIFFFRREDEPSVSGHMLGLGGLVTAIAPRLSTAAKKLVDTSRGMLVGVPRADLLAVFFVASGDLVTGAVNIIANVRANYEEDDPDRVSPWLYWVHGEHIEEMGYDLDAEEEVDSINFPDALLDRIVE